MIEMAGLITNAGKALTVNRLGNSTYTALSRFRVGSGTTEPAATDVAMTTLVQIGGEDYKALMAGYPSVNATERTIICMGTLSSTECNGETLTEFGLTNSDGSYILYSHDTHTAVIKSSSVQIIYKTVDTFA